MPAVSLFKLEPEIEKSEQLCCKFRDWYSKENVDCEAMNRKIQQIDNCYLSPGYYHLSYGYFFTI